MPDGPLSPTAADAALAGTTDALRAESGFGGCCPGSAAVAVAAPRSPVADRWSRAIGVDAEGRALHRVDFLAPDMRCGGCISKIEGGLSDATGVVAARANLSLRRVGVEFHPDETDADALAERLERLGFQAKPFDAEALDAYRADGPGRELLAAMAVAGFAAANVMLLSVSVWAGADAATRDLMHWISALIAAPAVAFAGRPFYRSAFQALRMGRINMDAPITFAVLLALGVSIYETAMSGPHAYFDAAVTLLFFLLVGRYLDHRMRGLARSAAAELTALSATAATIIGPDGSRREAPIDEVRIGDVVAVAPGDRLPVDGEIIEGRSDLDRSLVTGEAAPVSVGLGDAAHAGMLNLTGPLRLRVTAVAENTLLAEIARMIEAAERGATRHTRWADRAAKLYAPGVHIAAAVAFVGWVAATGDWRTSALIAAAVLIITCPCALALAVPAVQATAGGVLFRAGVFLKDGAALEKLAEVDTVVFDKTGTLTLGRPRLVDGPPGDDPSWPLAAALASGSRHPLSQALLAAAPSAAQTRPKLEAVREVPGAGVEALLNGETLRLGRGAWVGARTEPSATADPDGSTASAGGAPDVAASQVWFRRGDGAPTAFRFEDAPRPDAAEVVATLRARGLTPILLSGDRAGPVRALAARLGIEDARAELTPADKLAALEALAADGRKVLMVGDGVNDAPALAAAHASMSPASAAEVSQAAAGLVFLGDPLSPVTLAHRVAAQAESRARESFAFATVYNLVATPLAIAGFVTPLIAALAMSGSSVVVTLNALRLRFVAPKDGA